jgi:copper transport protein
VNPAKRFAAILLLVSCLVLMAPLAVGAHAFLVRSTPAPGAVLAHAPTQVRLFFDEPVKPASGIAVVASDGRSALAGNPFVPRSDRTEIVLPLGRRAGRGDYTVRWREIDVDDGHLIAGEFAFAVGSGLPPQHATLSAGGGGPTFSALACRWLLLVGLLVAAGTVASRVLVWKPVLRGCETAPLGASRDRADALVLAAALALAAVAALLSVVTEPGSSATRFGRWTEIGAAVSAVSAAAALASLRFRWLIVPAAVAAVALLALPTATGHASATGPSHGVSVPADLVHLAAAAFWVGGGLQLALVTPLVLRSLDPAALRMRYAELVRRYSPLAMVALLLLSATGIVQALTELSSFSQLWTTGYGRTLFVKSVLLGGLVCLGWVNRYRLTPALSRPDGRAGKRLRHLVKTELGLLAVLLGAVAVLTNIRPGRDYQRPPGASQSASAQTVALAGQDGDLAVGLALTPHGASRVETRVTVLGPNGPVSGLDLRILVSHGALTRFAVGASCGAGCYAAATPVDGSPRLVLVRIHRRSRAPATLAFAPPARWPAPRADAIVRRAGQTITKLRTLVVRSRLASDRRHEVTTMYEMVAPDRLAYQNQGGSQSVIIGGLRWDREPAGPWVEAQQNPPIRQPLPFWPPRFTDARLLATQDVDGRSAWKVSFLDPATPAWFTIWVDRRTYRTLRLDMIATAHFMHDRDGPFNAPITVDPPRQP